jgi:hypothetical protein
MWQIFNYAMTGGTSLLVAYKDGKKREEKNINGLLMVSASIKFSVLDKLYGIIFLRRPSRCVRT